MRSVITEAERVKFLAPESIAKQELVKKIADGIKGTRKIKTIFLKL